MKLDMTKRVQTRDGRPVTIKFTDGRGKYPIAGYIGDEDELTHWTLKGECLEGVSGVFDLINAPEWKLPEPPHGYEWHRTDWTEDMLPEGWRPLLLGEMRENDDEWTYNYKDNWNKVQYFGPDGCTVNEQATHHRTQRPLPLPKPKLQEVELCADDIKAGDEFLSPQGTRCQWGRIQADGTIRLAVAWRSLRSLKDEGWKIRSFGETEWRKCSKMQEVTV